MGFRKSALGLQVVAGLAIGASLRATEAAAFPELVVNGGFESSGPGFAWVGDNAFVGAGAPYGAPAGLNLVAGFAAPGTSAISQPVKVVPERVYALSFEYGVYANSAAPTGDGANILKISWGNGTIATLIFTQIGGGPGQVGSSFSLGSPRDTGVFTAPLNVLQAGGPASPTTASGWSRAAIIGFGSRGFRTGLQDLKFTYSYGDLSLFIDNVSLLVTWAGGPDAANTGQAMRRNAAALRGVMDRRLSILALAAGYDCQTFDKSGVCLSFQARYSSFDSMNEGAGVLTAAYRLSDTVRVGGFIDHRVSETEPTGIRVSDDLPIFGAFAGYSQNGDGTGFQAKAVAAFGRGDLTISRDDSLVETEAGSGKARLHAWMASGELGWGFALSASMMATPYVGMRHAEATRDAYAERASDEVRFPISYAAFQQRLTTAAAGVRVTGMLTDKVGFQIGAGLEHDLDRKTRAYSGASDIPGLDAFALPVDGARKRTRGVGSVGLFYQASKTMRLTGHVSVRSQALSHETQVSAMAGYQIAF